MTINNLSLFEVLNIIFYKIFKPELHLKNEPYISINGKNLWEYGFDYREPWSGESDTRKCNLIWRKQNIEIKDDEIFLKADKENDIINTGGLISSHKCININRGYIEVEAKMPPRGFKYFPAIWMYNIDTWLPEIDIVELMGKDSRYFTFTYHYFKNEKHCSKRSGFKHNTDLSLNYHRFGVLITKKYITWYLDRYPYFKTKNLYPDKKLFLICNIQAELDDDNCYIPFKEDEIPEYMIIKNINIT